MKKISTLFIPCLAAVLLMGGCQTSGPDSYVPLGTVLNGVENHDLLVVADSRIQYSVACPSVEEHMAGDGRLNVTAQLRNRENHAISLQVRCVFKDARGVPLPEAETPPQNVVLRENTITPVHFISPSGNAAHFSICIIQPPSAR